MTPTSPEPGRLGGVMAALATPLDSDGQLDHSGLDCLLTHILARPVTGICPAGSTGEGPLLGRSVRAELTSAVAATCPPGVEVIPASAGVSVESTTADIDAYAEAGATAVLVPPPSYYPMSPGAITAFYRAVVERAALPVVLYNIPAMTKVALPVPVVAELAVDTRVIGIKDSSRDMEYFSFLVAATERSPEFAVLTGSDTLLLPSTLIGGSGTIAASVNLVPGLVTDLYQATVVRHLHQARLDQQRLLAIVAACRRPGSPAGWKAALHAAGLCGLSMAAPGSEADAESIERLTVELEDLGVPVGNRGTRSGVRRS